MKKRHLQSLSSILHQITQQYGLHSRLQVLKFQENWEPIVGKNMAKHTFPLNLQFHKLTLLVDNPAWTQQLHFLQPKILKLLRHFTPNIEISEIRFKVGPLPKQESPLQKEETVPSPISADEKNYIEESLQPIQNPEMKESLRRLMFRAFQVGVKRIS